MGTLKKSKIKKAQDGTSVDPRIRQGNAPKEEPKYQAGEGPSKNEKDRQGNNSSTENKTPPNKFPEAKAPEKKTQSFGEAFKAARAAGKGPFTWTNPKTGKSSSYTTQTKEEVAKKAPAAKASPVAPPTKKAEPAKASPTPAKSTPASEKKDTAYVPPKKVDASTFKTPEKKTEVAPVKKTTSSSDSIRAKMKADNDTVMAKANRYYGKKYGSFKSGGKAKKC